MNAIISVLSIVLIRPGVDCKNTQQSLVCKSCLKIVDEGSPIPEEYSLKGIPDDCDVEECNKEKSNDVYEPYDVCYHMTLALNPKTTIHVHSCGITAYSDDYVCALFKYGAGLSNDGGTPCNITRCRSTDCSLQEVSPPSLTTPIVMNAWLTPDTVNKAEITAKYPRSSDLEERSSGTNSLHSLQQTLIPPLFIISFSMVLVCPEYYIQII